MTQPRRRIIRSHVSDPPSDHHRQHQVQKLQNRLTSERATLARWQSRLRRAFNAVEKSQKRIARIEKQLTTMED